MPLAYTQTFPKIILEIISHNSQTSVRSRQNNYYYPCSIDEATLAHKCLRTFSEVRWRVKGRARTIVLNALISIQQMSSL